MPRTRIVGVAAIVSVAATAATLAPHALTAQQVRIAALGAQTTHELLPRSRGVSGALTVPVTRRVGFSVLVERMAGDGIGTGVVCAGLINPEDCPAEPFDQRGTLFSLGLGAELSVWRNRYVHIAALPHLLAARARSAVHGAVTGNTLPTAKNQIGVSGALEARLVPTMRLPLAIVVGAATRRYGPVRRDMVVDGYTPFERWYTVRTAYVGATVSWTGRSSAPRPTLRE